MASTGVEPELLISKRRDFFDLVWDNKLDYNGVHPKKFRQLDLGRNVDSYGESEESRRNTCRQNLIYRGAAEDGRRVNQTYLRGAGAQPREPREP